MGLIGFHIQEIQNLLRRKCSSCPKLRHPLVQQHLGVISRPFDYNIPSLCQPSSLDSCHYGGVTDRRDSNATDVLWFPYTPQCPLPPSARSRRPQSQSPAARVVCAPQWRGPERGRAQRVIGIRVGLAVGSPRPGSPAGRSPSAGCEGASSPRPVTAQGSHRHPCHHRCASTLPAFCWQTPGWRSPLFPASRRHSSGLAERMHPILSLQGQMEEVRKQRTQITVNRRRSVTGHLRASSCERGHLRNSETLLTQEGFSKGQQVKKLNVYKYSS